MDYIQGLESQTRLFLFSLGFGVLLGIVYGFFRLVRSAISDGRVFTFFSDIAYSVVSTLLIFCFLLVFDFGRFRIYSLLGLLLGFAIWYLSLGSISRKLSLKIFHISKRLKRKIKEKFKKNSKKHKNILAKRT